MSAVLIETLVWTGGLIAAVLVLRRPVSRHFGPEAAYALWALPLVRLVLPPLTLPAWMAPQGAAAVASEGTLPAASPAPVDAALLAHAPLAEPAAGAGQAGFDLLAFLAALPLAEILLAVWLVGALVSLGLRFAAYFSLRDMLLAEGREVGRAPCFLGKIRLVETPATVAPLAMGVLDPVIALPPGFMALPDRPARDLALAHELAHHRGGDLLVNVLVQPLFALHWWNPLGRYGWLALRRDQEAACDARVMAERDSAERAAYAALIARFAAAPGAAHHAALTAPMACPVLGEKSIIHRLRSLNMSRLSPRRRWAGRALLGAGLLALPLTASISYAATEPATDAQVSEPPAPPALPAAPDGPDAPPAPPAPGEPRVVVIEKRIKHDGGEEEVVEHVIRGGDGNEKIRIMMRDLSGGPGGGLDRETIEKHFEALKSGKKAEREAAIAALRADMEARRARGDVMMLRRDLGAPPPPMPPVMVMSGCKPGSSDTVETSEDKDGRTRVMICQTRIADTARAGLKDARAGLEEARAEIAGDKSIPEATRKRVLQSLDAQIERLGDKSK